MAGRFCCVSLDSLHLYRCLPFSLRKRIPKKGTSSKANDPPSEISLLMERIHGPCSLEFAVSRLQQSRSEGVASLSSSPSTFQTEKYFSKPRVVSPNRKRNTQELQRQPGVRDVKLTSSTIYVIFGLHVEALVLDLKLARRSVSHVLPAFIKAVASLVSAHRTYRVPIGPLLMPRFRAFHHPKQGCLA